MRRKISLLCFLTSFSLSFALAQPLSTSTKGAAAKNIEAVAILRQVMGQLEHYVTAKDLLSIHNEDLLLSATLSNLINDPEFIEENKLEEYKFAALRLSRKVAALHLVADEMKQRESEAAILEVKQSYQSLLKFFPEQLIKSASILADKFTCPMHPEIIGARTELCAKCGMELDQPVRIMLYESGSSLTPKNSVKSSIKVDEELRPGVPNKAILRLSKLDGSPVLIQDLIETHTKRIHLLIVDLSLTDYHHEHPQPTDRLGEYEFIFTPKLKGPYRTWADLRMHPMGLQEYAVADIGLDTGPHDRKINREIVTKTAVDGLTFELHLGNSREIPLAVSVPARLTITNGDGTGFNKLEPIMATFAHLVGFSEDFNHVLHMHPKGAPITDEKLRGGPELEFLLYSDRPGYFKLFAQVQIDGKSKFAPFGIEVKKR